MQKLNRNQTK